MAITNKIHPAKPGRPELEARLARNQDSLLTLQRLNASILDSSHAGIMAFDAVRDAQGQIIDFAWTVANQASVRLTGKAPADLLGRHMLDVFPGNKDSGLFDAYVEVVESGAPYNTEVYYPFDGLDTWYDVTAVRHQRDAFMVTFTSITDQKQKEQQLKAVNDSLHNFASVAAHDLQAPLRHLGMYTDMLLTELDALGVERTDELTLAADGMTAMIARMRHLIRSLYQLSKLETDDIEFQPLSLPAILRAAGQQAAAHMDAAGAVLEIGDMPTIRGDEALLVSLFANLISNACKYSGADELKISISAADSPSGRTQIFVQDNGQGIPDVIHEKIFEPFQRGYVGSPKDGAGIGLSLCRRIATLHNGDIKVDPTFTDGARFIIELPASSQKLSDQDAAP